MSSPAPIANQFQLKIPSTGPGSTGAIGTSMAPGNNSYPAYTQIMTGSQVTDDAFGILININSMSSSGVARDSVIKIGVDQGGSTNYLDVILHLIGSCAGNIGGVGGGGIWWYFPLGIRAGSSIGASASVNNATVGTCSVYCKLYCKPSRPELVRAGSFVRTFGAVSAGAAGTAPAASAGTAITPGNGSKSAYAQLGSATVEPLWYWTGGGGVNNATMNNNANAVDIAIGDGSNKLDVIKDQIMISTTAEVLSYRAEGEAALSATGDFVYARMQSIGAPVTGWTAVAYAVGG